MSGATINLTTDNFEQIVLKAAVPVVVDFWASWCGPCTRLSPIIDQLADAMKEKAVFARVDADNQEGLARRFAISALPTLLFFKKGRVVDSVVGLKSRNEIEELVSKHI